MRRRWLLLANAPVIAWLLAAALCALTNIEPESRIWLLTHIALLGAAGTAILVWSQHFTAALLRVRDTTHGAEGVRVVAFNIGTIGLLIGTTTDHTPVALGGGLVVIGVFAWHVIALLRQVRTALPARFVVSVHYYIVATMLVLVGSTVGLALSSGHIEDPADARWNVAHVIVNVEGWLALTILGTLVTFWPTLLGTQVVDGGVRYARRLLPSLTLAVLVASVGTALGARLIAAAGQFGYVLALGWSLIPYAREMRTRARLNFASLSVLASQVWLIIWSASLLVMLTLNWTEVHLEERVIALIPVLIAGVAVQVLIGSLAFLVPMAIGLGPARVRANIAALDSQRAVRLVLLNLGVAVALVGAHGNNAALVRLGAAVSAVALLWFLALVGSVLIRHTRETTA